MTHARRRRRRAPSTKPRSGHRAEPGHPTHGETDHLRRAFARSTAPRDRQPRERGQGDARAEGPQRHPREDIRRADDYQGRRHGRERNRPQGSAREHGRADGQGSREQDVRRRRRRHHDRHRARAGDVSRGTEEPRRRRQSARAEARHGESGGGDGGSAGRPIESGERRHDRPGWDDLREQRRDDRPNHRRSHGQGRQGRRHHRRRIAHDGDDARRGRRHAARSRLSVAVLRHRSGADGSRPRGRGHPDSRKETPRGRRAAAAAREGVGARTAAADHRRGHRRRGARDAGGQQAARQPARRRDQGAGLRRSAHRDAPGHRRADRRPRHQRGSRHQIGKCRHRRSRTREEDHRRQGHDDGDRGRRLAAGDRGPRQADPRADRGHDVRLRPREAAGAAREAGRRRRDHQGRRRDRDRDDRKEGARRGRDARHQGRGRRGHRRGRRRRAAAGVGGAGDGDRRRRRADRRRHRPPRVAGADALDRRQCRRGRRRRRRARARDAGRRRLQRADRPVRGPRTRRHHRPDQGGSLRAAECRVGRGAPADDRSGDLAARRVIARNGASTRHRPPRARRAGVQRTSVPRLGRGRENRRPLRSRRDHLHAGRRLPSRHVHSSGWREAVGVVDEREGSGRRDARSGRLLRRRMSRRPAHPHRKRDGDHAERDPADRQSQDGAAAAHEAGDVRPVHRAHAGAQRPHRRRPDRSAVQLERETAGARAAATRALRQAGQPDPRDAEGVPGDAREDRGDDALAREFLPEQVQETRLHRL